MVSRYPNLIFGRRVLRYYRTMSTFGQPHPSTHKHLLSVQDEVNPGITRLEFQTRRNALVNRLLLRDHHDETTIKGLVLIPGSRKTYMIDKIPYFFRQNTDFRYLSGILQPGCALVLDFKSASSVTSILFLDDDRDYNERWDGPRSSFENPETAMFFGVDSTFPMSELETFLSSSIHASDVMYYDYHRPETNLAIHKTVLEVLKDHNNQKNQRLRLENPRKAIHELRSIKSSAEIDLMSASCRITSESIRETFSTCRHLRTEAEIFATVEYHCRMRSAPFLAYPPVVACGDNATVIHYISNNQALADGQCVLMDVGCEYHGYASDITRTFPVNGRFTDPQKILYEMVLDVQTALLRRLNSDPSSVTLDGLYRSMQAHLSAKLKEVGILKTSYNVTNSHLLTLANRLCPHHVSHFLGMDVHDTAMVSRSESLKPGMVLTVEPGIYIPREFDFIKEEFRGIGVRIEDDILITENGSQVLTETCPKSVEDIENMCCNRQR